MRAASLFAVLALAKLLMVAGRPIPVGVCTLPALLWQDALVALLFAGFDSPAARSPLSRPQGSSPVGRLKWLVYGALVAYAAVNVAVARILGSPLTVPMLRAARGTLSDSILHYATWGNLGLMVLVAAAGALAPFALRRVPGRPLAAAGLLLVLVGPFASGRVDARGLHRNAVVAVAASAVPRVAAREGGTDWRGSIGEGEELSALRGSAAGWNVVLVALESTGARHLRPDAMPNVSRLASRSLVFENAYCVYPESIRGLHSVLCATSPAMDTTALAAAPSVAEILRGRGYRTGLFHSGRFAYLGMEAVVRDRGFDTLADAGDLGGGRESSFGVDEDAAVRRILEWVDAAPGPFFVSYLPVAGHHPYGSAGGPFPDGEERGAHLNALHEGDRALGTLFEGLRERGLWERTLVVLHGDHGEAFGEHEGNVGHTLAVWEENVRVPLLIAGPGDGRRVGRMASLVDVAPTLLDLLGVGAPGEWEGRTLLSGPERSALFFADYSLALAGLREGRWKFIHELESGRSRLFDLDADPGETRDLAAMHPGRVGDYRDRLLGWCAAMRGRALNPPARDP